MGLAGMRWHCRPRYIHVVKSKSKETSHCFDLHVLRSTSKSMIIPQDLGRSRMTQPAGFLLFNCNRGAIILVKRFIASHSFPPHGGNVPRPSPQYRVTSVDSLAFLFNNSRLRQRINFFNYLPARIIPPHDTLNWT
jgi:hypothetical protein